MKKIRFLPNASFLIYLSQHQYTMINSSLLIGVNSTSIKGVYFLCLVQAFLHCLLQLCNYCLCSLVNNQLLLMQTLVDLWQYMNNRSQYYHHHFVSNSLIYTYIVINTNTYDYLGYSVSNILVISCLKCFWCFESLENHVSTVER